MELAQKHLKGPIELEAICLCGYDGLIVSDEYEARCPECGRTFRVIIELYAEDATA